MGFYAQFLKTVESKLPSVAKVLLGHPLAPQLISPGSVKVKTADFKKIQDFVKVLTHAISRPTYQPNSPAISKIHQKGHGAFTSFDFHLTEDGPRLIEINTNASGLLWSACIQETQGLVQPQWQGLSHLAGSIRKMLEAESQATGRRHISSIGIVDEAPTEQKAYSEFLAYQALFQDWGWNAEIVDVKDLFIEGDRLTSRNGEKFDLVYNRSTDFYFEKASHLPLRRAYEEDLACVTPSPYHYGYLADKERLIQFVGSEFQNITALSPAEQKLFSQIIPRCGYLSEIPEFDRAKLKGLFLKPLRSHGGKAVYKGESISRTKFDEIKTQDYIFQTTVPAPKTDVVIQDQSTEFKWDLRVYAYSGEIQLLSARLYQGQMTNTQTLGGGLGAVEVSD